MRTILLLTLMISIGGAAGAAPSTLEAKRTAKRAIRWGRLARESTARIPVGDDKLTVRSAPRLLRLVGPDLRDLAAYEPERVGDAVRLPPGTYAYSISRGYAYVTVER